MQWIIKPYLQWISKQFYLFEHEQEEYFFNKILLENMFFCSTFSNVSSRCVQHIFWRWLWSVHLPAAAVATGSADCRQLYWLFSHQVMRGWEMIIWHQRVPGEAWGEAAGLGGWLVCSWRRQRMEQRISNRISRNPSLLYHTSKGWVKGVALTCGSHPSLSLCLFLRGSAAGVVWRCCYYATHLWKTIDLQ